FRWGRYLHGAPLAVLALFFFTFTPSILAHAGLATTDMALTATLGASLFAGVLWLDSPTPKRCLWFGLWTGLAVLSKFSTLVFWPACAAATLAVLWIEKRPSLSTVLAGLKRRAPTLALAIATGALAIWAGYRFSFSSGLPAPELFEGIQQVRQHNDEGHSSFLLGKRSSTGFWYFFEVALAVKTPIALLLL